MMGGRGWGALSLSHVCLCSPALLARKSVDLTGWGELLGCYCFQWLRVVFIYLLIYFAKLRFIDRTQQPLGSSSPPTTVHREIISCWGVGNRCPTDIFPSPESNSAVFLPPDKLPASCCVPLPATYLVGLFSLIKSRANPLVWPWSIRCPPFRLFSFFISFIPFWWAWEGESAAWVSSDSSPLRKAGLSLFLLETSGRKAVGC